MSEMRSVAIPKDRMAIGKFLRHAELVPGRAGVMLVLTGVRVKVNGKTVGAGDIVVPGDIVAMAGGPMNEPSWEPEDVVHVRVKSSSED
jgi:ribosomal 50S subunit-recycling heat shock protein